MAIAGAFAFTYVVTYVLAIAGAFALTSVVAIALTYVVTYVLAIAVARLTLAFANAVAFALAIMFVLPSHLLHKVFIVISSI